MIFALPSCVGGIVESQFLDNGVDATELDQYQAQKETRFIGGELCLSAMIGLTLSAGLFVWLSVSQNSTVSSDFFLLLALIPGAASLVGAFIGFAKIAADDNKIPASFNTCRPHRHVTGLGAAAACFVLTFVIVAGWVGQKNYPDFEIPEIAGQFVVVGIALIFAGLLSLSKITNYGGPRSILRGLRRISSPFNPIGRWLSWADSMCVYVIAPTVGASLRGVFSRYLVMLGHIAIATLFSWFAPAPYGLLGTAWALFAVISLTRRWTWIEEDRRELINNPSGSELELKVGTEEDLRDEAIYSLLFLILVLPIGMRQFELLFPSAQIFNIRAGAEDSLPAWTAFFGIELLKALPFIDWADTYQASGDTRIETGSILSMHVVVAARALIDVVFLSTLFQAVSISVSLSRNRRDFVSGKADVDRLDDRIEVRELEKLAHWDRTRWEFSPDIEYFKRYNTDRLSRLRLNARPESKLYAVIQKIFEMTGADYTPPSEQLVDVARETKVDRVALRRALDLVLAYKDFDVHQLDLPDEA